MGPSRQQRGPVLLRRRADSGMVIAETAIAIPVLTAVALVLAWVVSLGIDVLGLADAARQVARDVARGVTIDAAVDAVALEFPDAAVTVEESGEWVTVSAEAVVRAPIPVLSGIAVPIRQSVTLAREWS
jgi:Flp pilus assembly protein TadG